ncbi:MAG: TonB-dependent receptor [Acidobacteriia bacterium]|nr:TonB-dependent receptor [Terriglobia bacterium]
MSRSRFACLRLSATVLSFCIFLAPSARPQVMDGRLEVRVIDPSGQGVPAALELVSRSPQFVAGAVADAEGRATLHRIPPGTYLLTARHEGFEIAERRIALQSAVPRVVEIALSVATVREEVTVRAPAPLFEPYRPSQGTRSGRDDLEQALGTTLGRSTVDMVTAMPGWLLEANAVLHPRGSEYDTQYVIDGMPLYDNRSIAFAPAFENSEFEAVTVLTAGIPAEYGRRLGGVIALDTRRSAISGHRTSLDVQAGSYATRIGAFSHQYASGGTELTIGIQGGGTDRYLDPPSLENFTNRGSSGGGNARFARDLRSRHRLTGYARTNRTNFLVPNDLVQQEAGQRQDRRSSETAGQVHYQGTLSRRTLISVRGMLRDLTSELWSNELSTPVYVLQDRGFSQGVVMADVTFEAERHTLKIGGDIRSSGLRERFLMAEPDELPDFDLDFRDRQRSTEASFYAYDQLRAGNFAASIGFRFDEYRLLISDRAFSPRLAASYFVPPAGLQLYASYDRIFQPPPTENLLLSSAATGFGLDAVEEALAVPANKGHFIEIGMRKPIGDAMRIDAKHYWRQFRNYIDDDVFLNTGLSFPITFDSAAIEGTEVRIEAHRWKGISAVASYSNMLGRARSPVTGGLFVEGGEAEELRDVVEEFPISQDQRNTVATTVRFQIHPRVWASFGIRYGSGLPVELEDDDDDDDDDDHGDDDHGDDDDDDDDDDDHGHDDDHGEAQPVPAAILRKVNFARSRVRPNLSLDFSVGSRVWEEGSKSATLQFDLRNATNRLNVINFSGLFSGTALAPGRQATVQLRVRF